MIDRNKILTFPLSSTILSDLNNIYFRMGMCLNLSSISMSETIAITDAITTISEAEWQFGLIRNEDPDFFGEWQRCAAELTAPDTSQLADLRRRYVYHRSAGHLLGNTVTLLLVSPLLAIAGFYDPPFRVRAEESVKLVIQDSEEILQGRIDALVICDSFWVMVLESKKTMLSIWSALPQALAYLMANPHLDRGASAQGNCPGFGMLTNGDEMLFVKVAPAQYGLSRVFSPFVADAELMTVLKIMRHFGAGYEIDQE
jgi:hypothetical protein